MRASKSHLASPLRPRHTACGRSLFSTRDGLLERVQTMNVVDADPTCERCRRRTCPCEGEDDDPGPHLPTDDTCRHPPVAITAGPRVPLVYGSAATEVCTACNAWRTMHHYPGPWQTDSTVEEAAREEDSHV